MKKGPIILVAAGLALLVVLYTAPYSPGSAAADLQEEETMDEDTSHSHASADDQVDEALQQMQSGELPPMQAVLKIRSIADEHPDNLKAQFTLGVMSMQTGQYDKAIERFEKVLEISPSPEAMKMLAQAYEGSGNMEKARENYQRALENTDEQAEKEALQVKLNELNIN